jgi:uncharacterized membrane protein YgdD (TMEM256/DUF423 family)
VVVGVGSFALFGLVTGLIPNPLYTRMVPRTGLDYLFLALTAGFLGAYAFQRTPGGRGDDTTATAGTVLGFLAFGCPVCNAFLLALFGSSALMTYFDPVRPLLGGVGVALFAGLLYARSRRTCETCVDDGSLPSTADR